MTPPFLRVSAGGQRGSSAPKRPPPAPGPAPLVLLPHSPPCPQALAGGRLGGSGRGPSGGAGPHAVTQGSVSPPQAGLWPCLPTAPALCRGGKWYLSTPSRRSPRPQPRHGGAHAGARVRGCRQRADPGLLRLPLPLPRGDDRSLRQGHHGPLQRHPHVHLGGAAPGRLRRRHGGLHVTTGQPARRRGNGFGCGWRGHRSRTCSLSSTRVRRHGGPWWASLERRALAPESGGRSGLGSHCGTMGGGPVASLLCTFWDWVQGRPPPSHNSALMVRTLSALKMQNGTRTSRGSSRHRAQTTRDPQPVPLGSRGAVAKAEADGRGLTPPSRQAQACFPAVFF